MAQRSRCPSSISITTPIGRGGDEAGVFEREWQAPRSSENALLSDGVRCQNRNVVGVSPHLLDVPRPRCVLCCRLWCWHSSSDSVLTRPTGPYLVGLLPAHSLLGQGLDIAERLVRVVYPHLNPHPRTNEPPTLPPRRPFPGPYRPVRGLWHVPVGTLALRADAGLLSGHIAGEPRPPASLTPVRCCLDLCHTAKVPLVG